MENGLVKLGRYTVMFLAFGIAAHAMRMYAIPFHIWPGIDDGIRHVIERVPVQALAHMLFGPIALFAGALQFWPALRARRPRVHRWTGRTYMIACLISGVGAAFTAPFASGGIVAAIGFEMLALSWLFVNINGWRAALQGRFDQHRIWMRFSYAMTFGAVTLRLQIPIGMIFLGFHSYPEMSVWLAYTSWIPNVIVVALYTWLRKSSRAPLAMAAAE
jgi:hypothetical protein